YGRTIPNLGVEALTWTLTLTAPERRAEPDVVARGGARRAPANGQRPVFDPERGDFITAAVLERKDLPPGATFAGPALIMEAQTTTFVPAAFDGSVSGHGHLVLKRRPA